MWYECVVCGGFVCVERVCTWWEAGIAVILSLISITTNHCIAHTIVSAIVTTAHSVLSVMAALSCLLYKVTMAIR